MIPEDQHPEDATVSVISRSNHQRQAEQDRVLRIPGSIQFQQQVPRVRTQAVPPTVPQPHGPAPIYLSHSHIHNLSKFSVRSLSASEAQLFIESGMPLITPRTTGTPPTLAAGVLTETAPALGTGVLTDVPVRTAVPSVEAVPVGTPVLSIEAVPVPALRVRGIPVRTPGPVPSAGGVSVRTTVPSVRAIPAPVPSAGAVSPTLTAGVPTGVLTGTAPSIGAVPVRTPAVSIRTIPATPDGSMFPRSIRSISVFVSSPESRRMESINRPSSAAQTTLLQTGHTSDHSDISKHMGPCLVAARTELCSEPHLVSIISESNPCYRSSRTLNS